MLAVYSIHSRVLVLLRLNCQKIAADRVNGRRNPFDHRMSRFVEAVAIIHGLLKDGAADFAGRFYAARECALRPRGPRPGGPPLLIGALGTGARMLDPTAKYADCWNGWLVGQGSRPEAVPALRAAVDAACLRVGRDPTTLERAIAIAVNTNGASESPQAWPSFGSITPLTGTPEEPAATLHAFARQGITHIQICPRPCTMAGVEALAPILDQLARQER